MLENVKKFPEEAEESTEEQDEEQESEQESEQAEKTAGEETAKKEIDPQKVVEQVARGKLTLSKPILSKGVNYDVLHYDFLALTGFEYADAMDSDASRNADSFHLTNRQALSLFAVAVSKVTEDVDKEAVIRGLSIGDTIKAVQLATVFFVTSSRAGNRRITRE